MQNYREIPVTDFLEEEFAYPIADFPFDIWIDDYSELKNHTLNCHWHDFFEFGYVLSGSFDYFINGTHFKLAAGDAVFIHARALHMAIADNTQPENKIFGFLFHHSLLTGLVPFLFAKFFEPLTVTGIQGFKICSTSKNGQALIQEIHDCMQLDVQQAHAELTIIAHMSQVWQAILDFVASEPEALICTTDKRGKESETKAILSYIYQNYQQKFTIDDMCQAIGISRSECFRCFKKFTHQKPMTYVNEYRLFQAEKALRETNAAIERIAETCGFASTSYFSKQFKERYQLTPLQYRKNSKLRTYF